MAASSPGANAPPRSVPPQASPPRLKDWFSARLAAAALAAVLPAGSKLAALLLVLTLLQANRPTVLALLLPHRLPPWRFQLPQRSKQPRDTPSATAASTAPSALVKNWVLAVALGLWLFLPSPARTATSLAALIPPAACCSTPKRCLAAPCARTRTQVTPTTGDGWWTFGALPFQHPPTTAELSYLGAYKARLVGPVLCLILLTVHPVSPASPEHCSWARPHAHLQLPPRALSSIARPAGAPQMLPPIVPKESPYTTCSAHLAVLAELSSLFDDSKARYTAKTPTSQVHYDYYKTLLCLTFIIVFSRDPLSMLPTGHGHIPDLTDGCCGAASVGEGCALGVGAKARVGSLV